MQYDTVIRGGTIIDGSGMPGYRADLGIVDGRIARIGRIATPGVTDIDAAGLVVTPGFIDGHTHMDAQVFWNAEGTSSSWHGVTTVVMGNCGFTLAPADPARPELVVRNLERAEDISPEALDAGIEWSWSGFDEFLDAVDRRPKAINYAGYVGHSALRTWAMGERAFTDVADDSDLATMADGLRSALRAGAVGLSTSRSETHETSDDRPVASRVAAWSELEFLVDVVSEFEDRLLQISVESAANSPDQTVRGEVFERMKQLTLRSGVPMTFGVISPGDGRRWPGMRQLIDDTNAEGGRMFAQGLPREMTLVISFQNRLPFDRLPEWAPVRALPFAEQRAVFEDPAQRAALVEAARNGTYADSLGASVRPPDYDKIRLVVHTDRPNPTLNELAAERGTDPINLIIDLGLETDFEVFFTQQVGNPDEAEVLDMLTHPRMIPTFSDSGAHVTGVMESSIQTYVLAYWVRQRGELSLEEAVRLMTYAPSQSWGFHDRGLLREGMVADINVFDPNTVGPGDLAVVHDLPAGAMRLTQNARGFKATLVAGEITIADGVHTGTHPGRVIRRSLHQPTQVPIDQENQHA